ncbi:PTS transporter subunit EIIC [Clostridium paridis]|uniref:PTS transporter subunit EIIC n=1 Tax=Clostridium paridis TaxID=2803863 RepID=A0A937K6M5_9CLOT|nr:PTS transporter subunit EIIC [Clostridium paridis]MBL4934065.1 PTS transporter subunit EIIC [Clostridium paridis]
MNSKSSYLHSIGKSLMLPVAVMPLAGILLRLGVYFNNKIVLTSGDVIFSYLPLIFAVAIAVGLSKDNNGSAGVASVMGYLVMTNVAKAINETFDMKVLAGIIIGIISAEVYNRFSERELPLWLNFFGGKRLVVIITFSSSFIFGIILGYAWPLFQSNLISLANWIYGAGALGDFVYGFLNRLLIPFGLHHVINTQIWTMLGEYNGVKGDLNRFFAGDPNAGAFMTGFFPVMLFGLPSACLAMLAAAKKENRKYVGGAFIAVALTSFLTGITEPVEFLFMFLAPILFVVHALLTGISLVIVNLLGIRNGFTFSAGLVDYLVNLGIAEKPILLIIVGIIFGIIYFVIFYFLIIKLDLKTPGREDDLGFVTILSKSISDVSKIATRISKGDLTVEIDEKMIEQSGEVGNLANSFNDMIANLHKFANHLKEVSLEIETSSVNLSDITGKVASTSEAISGAVENISNGAVEQATDTQKGATEVSTLGDIIEKDQEYLKSLNIESKNVVSVVVKGNELIEALNEKATETEKAVETISKDIEKTFNGVNKIKEVSNFIASISEQTNLLALNASIEAARAGEAGRGFAVVADEIRKLSEASKQSTDEIDKAVNQLMKDAESSVKVSEDLVKIMDVQNISVSETSSQFEEISKSINEISSIINEMNKSGQVMERAKSRIMDVMSNLSAIAEENAASTEETRASVEEETQAINEVSRMSDQLSDLASKIKEISEFFKVK